MSIRISIDTKGRLHPPTPKRVQSLEDVKSNEKIRKLYSEFCDDYRFFANCVDEVVSLDNENISWRVSESEWQASLPDKGGLFRRMFGTPKPHRRVDSKGIRFDSFGRRKLHGKDLAKDEGLVVLSGPNSACQTAECSYDPKSFKSDALGGVSLVEGVTSFKASKRDEKASRDGVNVTLDLNFSQGSDGVELLTVSRRKTWREYETSTTYTPPPPNSLRGGETHTKVLKDVTHTFPTTTNKIEIHRDEGYILYTPTSDKI